MLRRLSDVRKRDRDENQGWKCEVDLHGEEGRRGWKVRGDVNTGGWEAVDVKLVGGGADLLLRVLVLVILCISCAVVLRLLLLLRIVARARAALLSIALLAIARAASTIPTTA